MRCPIFSRRAVWLPLLLAELMALGVLAIAALACNLLPRWLATRAFKRVLSVVRWCERLFPDNCWYSGGPWLADSEGGEA